LCKRAQGTSRSSSSFELGAHVLERIALGISARLSAFVLTDRSAFEPSLDDVAGVEAETLRQLDARRARNPTRVPGRSTIVAGCYRPPRDMVAVDDARALYRPPRASKPAAPSCCSARDTPDLERSQNAASSSIVGARPPL